MQQGYSREITVECAIQFSRKPPVVEKAEYIIIKVDGQRNCKIKTVEVLQYGLRHVLPQPGLLPTEKENRSPSP
jgi:hypothetical protein